MRPVVSKAGWDIGSIFYASIYFVEVWQFYQKPKVLCILKAPKLGWEEEKFQQKYKFSAKRFIWKKGPFSG